MHLTRLVSHDRRPFHLQKAHRVLLRDANFFRCIVLLDVSFSLVPQKLNDCKDNMGTKFNRIFDMVPVCVKV